jgi:hypothetical protein
MVMKSVTFGELNEPQRAKPPLGLPPDAERDTSRHLPFLRIQRGISAPSADFFPRQFVSRR